MPKNARPSASAIHKHQIPSTRVISAEDAYVELARDCAEKYGNGSVLLPDDENTHVAAGAQVAELLEEHSLTFELVTLPGDMVATEKLAERLHDASAGHNMIIAVGAGTINDLGKYVSDKRGIPYWSAPTAPSMNGYTSSIVAIKVKGVKRTLPAHPPQLVYADPQVLTASPLRLRQAGFCDVLAKSVSDFDWQTESLLFNGSYCSLPSAIVSETATISIIRKRSARATWMKHLGSSRDYCSQVSR
jgi:glycerol-1-phosphate dehydrogenase [NAD(P)+]